MAKKTAAKPAAEKLAGEPTKPSAPAAGDAGAESAPPASSDAGAEAAAATAAAAVTLDSVLSGAPVTSLDVSDGTGGTVTADPDSEIEGATETRISGWVIECKRARGIWRAGRFWPPEAIAVPAGDLSDAQLVAILGEPLLQIDAVEL